MSSNQSGKIGNFFRTINNLNATTKVLLLVLYTFILVGATFLITNAINQSQVDRAFKGYATNTEDENIYLSLRLSEERSLTSSKEQGRYRFFGVIFGKPNLGVEIYIEKVEYSLYTELGKMVFEEKNPTTSKLTTYYSFNSYTDRRVSNSLNEAPHTVYIKVLYYIIAEGNNKINKELKIKEKVDYEEPNDKDYSLFTVGVTGKIENEYFSLTLKQAEPSETKAGQIKMEFRTIEKGLVKHLKYRSYVSVDNHETDTEQFVPDYIILANYYGSFNTIDMTNTIRKTMFDFSTYAIPLEYHPKFLYIKVEIETYDDQLKEMTYRIDIESLPAA